ncbi:MAG: DAK2 domain-containing protein [Candidatus Humimicrobiaceae bacterium]
MEFEGLDVKKALQIIVDHFKSNETKINNLNVFPVPDGDTGTNMLLTLKSIKKELSNLKQYDIKEIGEAISFGGLMGARGSSGVILSQVLKGFFDILKKDDIFNLAVLENALLSSKNLAYSSVQNPTEGTMLTIVKDLYLYMKNFNETSNDEVSLSKLIDNLISETEKSLVRTTYLLPVLKEANVVDAGAQGVLEILKGLKLALIDMGRIDGNLKGGEIVEIKYNESEIKKEIEVEKVTDGPAVSKEIRDWNVNSDIKYIYCTEFVLTGQKINIARLRDDIESLGDSAMVVGNENMVKIHVHSNNPHRVLARALREGILHEIQINNMVDQNKDKINAQPAFKAVPPTIGLISISNGEGIEEILRSVGVDIVIKSGQTMNPSTYELVKAIKKLDNEKIIIFPNNKNIILTATQAAKISKRDVIVMPTKTIPQGINAVINFNKDLTLEENLKNMEEAYSKIKSGEITVAVRDANLLVGEIKKGDFIGLFDGKIKVVSDNVISATIELIKDMIGGNDSIITFYLGRDSKDEDREKIRLEVSRNYPDLDIEFHNGGQPFYSYIFSIE